MVALDSTAGQRPPRARREAGCYRALMICQVCGVEAPTRKVTFHQNIGALVLRFHQSMDGQLCKRCIHKTFWRMTAINLVVGWWGVISFIVTPFFTINNVVYYALSARLPPPAKDAKAPELDARALERLGGVADRLVDRLNRGEPFEVVVPQIAQLAGVTPGQVVLFVRGLLAASKEEPAS